MDLPLWKAVVLGVVQGLTEFLPISSSGHLVLFESLLGVELPGITFEVVAHAGTLLAVMFVYWQDVRRLFNGMFRGGRSGGYADRRLLLLVVLGTVPAVVVGLAIKPYLTAIFGSLILVAYGWIITAALLLVADRRLRMNLDAAESSHNDPDAGLTVGRVAAIGAVQALAIWPGISRSGSTITAGLLLGLDRQTAARFSFLLAMPAIAGGVVLDLGNIWREVSGGGAGGTGAGILALLAIFVAAALSGYAAIRFLLRTLQRGRLSGFALYCLILGVLTLIIVLWNPSARVGLTGDELSIQI